ncbi:LPD29 domain-containing protein [Paenibacillus odorifer]|uniref:LPD29 domain-containing protein n=1 Tax=Paenibacillus odorifer TaxID=189426 RepID=UPI00096DD9BE|nr:LPD29 domain-containing protein [Paenibacillus odorifer]OMD09838.1 hypothetical protein BJP50_29335 [Paenibacillus odorifer]
MDCVQTAKEIRTSLKVAFPNVKFSVRSSRFSMGSSVDVSWTNMPSRSAVEAIISKYDRVRRCEYTGEILSGGNMYVSANIKYTTEFKAEVESKMDECDINNLYRYQRVFDEIVDQMWVEQNATGRVEIEETAGKEKLADTDNTVNEAKLTINQEKNGIEIRFTYKPSANILVALSDLGFKWSSFNGGKWWAKQTPERLTYATTLVDTFNSIIPEEQTIEAVESQPVPQEQQSNVVSYDKFTQKKVATVNNKYTPEQKFKMYAIQLILGMEDTSKLLFDTPIDELFTYVANAADTLQKIESRGTNN